MGVPSFDNTNDETRVDDAVEIMNYPNVPNRAPDYADDLANKSSARSSYGTSKCGIS